MIFTFTEDQNLLLSTVEQFSKALLAPSAFLLDEQEGFNSNAFKKMGEMGLLGLTVAEKYGGSGLGCFESTLVMEKMAESCASTTLSYLAHSILCVNNLHENASVDQKKRYLPSLVSGQWIGGMGITEPGAGSDALGLQTRALKKGDRYFLTGTKTFITNGPVGDVFVIYAKTGQSKKDISTFIVEKKFPGFRVGKKLNKLGMRASPTSELILEQCEVPIENLVGKENESVTHMMNNLTMERVTISGISLGIARAALNYSLKYSKERTQFNTPLSQFQMIQHKFAEMSSQLDAGTALVYACASAFDRGNHAMFVGASAKLFSAQMATQVALEAIQILGGYGYTKEFPVERYMRDAKLMEIGAGTNEVMRLILAKHLLGPE